MGCILPGSSIHGIFRQEYWNGLPSPSPGDIPNLGIEARSPALQADSLPKIASLTKDIFITLLGPEEPELLPESFPTYEWT